MLLQTEIHGAIYCKRGRAFNSFFGLQLRCVRATPGGRGDAVLCWSLQPGAGIGSTEEDEEGSVRMEGGGTPEARPGLREVSAPEKTPPWCHQNPLQMLGGVGRFYL